MLEAEQMGVSSRRPLRTETLANHAVRPERSVIAFDLHGLAQVQHRICERICGIRFQLSALPSSRSKIRLHAFYQPLMSSQSKSCFRELSMRAAWLQDAPKVVRKDYRPLGPFPAGVLRTLSIENALFPERELPSRPGIDFDPSRDCLAFFAFRICPIFTIAMPP